LGDHVRRDALDVPACGGCGREERTSGIPAEVFFFKQKTAYELGLGIPAEPLFRSVNATPLPTVNTTGYIDHAAFLGTINPDTNKIPKHLFQGYLNIYNNYFKAPWMPDRTEANPNELNQDDARYGFRCCHLK